MPEDITQRLGFDASKAIQELTRLQGQLSSFKQALQSTTGALQQFSSTAAPITQSMRQLAGSAGTAGAAVTTLGAQTKSALAGLTGYGNKAVEAAQKAGRLGTASKSTGAAIQRSIVASSKQGAKSLNHLGLGFKKAGEEGAAAGNAITLSWKTVGRIIAAQVVIRALSAIVGSFGEARQAAEDFSVAVAEAFTISGGELGNMAQMSESTRDLARALGEPALEVAEGLYQTLSNQVTEAGDAIRFEAKAAELAIATNSELKDAVNALSSVMNSYNLNVSETERVSDVLFKTIELGRLRLNEFGNVLGRVSPLTAVLGIRYQEMAAAIAALTQKGVPAHTAITQLTQVSQKLLRPTTKLQELYEEWGVETGPEAIKRFGGLQGVLLKMKDATAGNDKEFADLLGRVRAMVGALNLTSNEASALDEAMRAMAASAGSTSKALEEMRDSAGRQSVEAWNRLGTTMLEVGDTLLEITTPIAAALDKMLQNIILLKAAALGAAAGFTAMKIGAISLAGASAKAAAGLAAMRATLNSLGPLIIAVAAAMAAAQITEWVVDWLDNLEELEVESKRHEEALTKVHEALARQRTQTTQKEFDERRKITGEFFSAASRQYKADFDILEASSKAVGATLTDTIDTLLKKRQEAVKAVTDAGTAADSALKESMQIVAETQKSIAEDAFNQEVRHLSERQKLWAEIERAQDAAAKARQAYAKAGANEEATAAARELSNIAEKRAKDAEAHAQELGNQGDIKRAESELLNIRNDRIKAEFTFQVKREKLQSKTHQDRLKQMKEEGVAVEDLLTKVKNLMDPFVDGLLKGPAQMKKDFERVLAIMPELEKRMKSAFDFSLFESLRIESTLGQLQKGVIDALAGAKIDWARVTNDFQQVLAARQFEAPVTLKITNQAIIEEIVKRFGEIDPLGDPGQLADKGTEVLEGFITKNSELRNSIEFTTQSIEGGIEDIFNRLAPENWFNAWDRAMQALTQAAGSVSADYTGVTDSINSTNKSAGETVSVAEQLRQKMLAAAEGVKKAFQEQRGLSTAEAEAINELERFGQKYIDNGVLAERFGDKGVAVYKKLIEFGNKANKVAAETAEKAKIAPAVEEATRLLEQQKSQAEAVKEAQAGVAGEADKTTTELEAGVKAQGALPEAAAAATQSLATEAEQAALVHTELQGATDAQRALVEAQKAGGVTPGAVAPEPRQISQVELQAQLEATRQLQTALIGIHEQYNAIVATNATLAESMNLPTEAATQIRDILVQSRDAAGGINTGFTNATQSIGVANQALSNTLTSLNSNIIATNSLVTSTSSWNQQLQNCVQSAGLAAQAMNLTAQAALQAAQACAQASAMCSGGNVTAAKGGRYFAVGGRGTDTIPSMLSPGEFVVNARSARNFFPQLQAMNAGQQPVYREQGGSVTNVGDVNVTVQGGDNSQLTIREIAYGLRRELSRGTIKL